MFSQVDTLQNINIPEVNITQMRLQHYQTSIKKVQIDSMKLQTSTSLAEVLQMQNYLQMQAYSPGQLATPSFRGTSANHTAVLWNGFNLQSQMNGQVDFSLLQNLASNNVKIQFGGSSALFGSGALGGVVHLQNNTTYNKGINLIANLQMGSFANFRQQAEVIISNKNSNTEIKIFNHSIQNDFKYKNIYLPENQIVNQINAASYTQGLVINQSFKWKKNNQIQVNIWLQNSERQIPPSMLSQRKKDSQIDQFLRSSLSYSLSKNKISLQARAAYFIEKIQFNRYLTDTSINVAHTAIAEVESNLKTFQNQDFQIGINHTFAYANGENLYQAKLARFAIFSSYKIALFKEKLKIQISAREQFQNSNLSPITFGFGTEYRIQKNIKLALNSSKNFRLPTFNDLYWTDASGAKGNANLKPESGWSQDVSVEYCFNKIKNTIITSQVALFSSFTDNWISWRLNNFGQLTPQNLLSVWARGVEFSINYTYQKNKIYQNATFNCDYTVSTIEKTNDFNTNALKKQLIYVPYNKAFLCYTFGYNKIKLSYQISYTGFRYSTEDNEEFLSAFSVSNIELNQDFIFKKYATNIFIRCNNIFNKNYQIMATRPMYGLNFNVGLIIKFYQPNKS